MCITRYLYVRLCFWWASELNYKWMPYTLTMHTQQWITNVFKTMIQKLYVDWNVYNACVCFSSLSFYSYHFDIASSIWCFIVLLTQAEFWCWIFFSFLNQLYVFFHIIKIIKWIRETFIRWMWIKPNTYSNVLCTQYGQWKSTQSQHKWYHLKKMCYVFFYFYEHNWHLFAVHTNVMQYHIISIN